MLAARYPGSARLEEHAIPLASATRVVLNRFHQVFVDSHNVFPSLVRRSF
jgi:hypothetical protein